MTEWTRLGENEDWQLGYVYRDVFAEASAVRKTYLWMPVWRGAPNDLGHTLYYLVWTPAGGWPSGIFSGTGDWSGGPRWEKRPLTDEEKVIFVARNMRRAAK